MRLLLLLLLSGCCGDDRIVGADFSYTVDEVELPASRQAASAVALSLSSGTSAANGLGELLVGHRAPGVHNVITLRAEDPLEDPGVVVRLLNLGPDGLVEPGPMAYAAISAGHLTQEVGEVELELAIDGQTPVLLPLRDARLVLDVSEPARCRGLVGGAVDATWVREHLGAVTPDVDLNGDGVLDAVSAAFAYRCSPSDQPVPDLPG